MRSYNPGFASIGLCTTPTNLARTSSNTPLGPRSQAQGLAHQNAVPVHREPSRQGGEVWQGPPAISETISDSSLAWGLIIQNHGVISIFSSPLTFQITGKVSLVLQCLEHLLSHFRNPLLTKRELASGRLRHLRGTELCPFVISYLFLWFPSITQVMSVFH